MKYLITIGNFTGEKYGIVFTHGKAETEDTLLACRLKAKGIQVTNIPEKKVNKK